MPSDSFVYLRTVLGHVFILFTLEYDVTLGSQVCGMEERTINGKYLQGSKFGQVNRISLLGCVAECYSYVICRSFNFNTVTKLCSLNFEDNEMRPQLITDGFFNVYSNIKDWPQLISGPCQEKACGKHEQCIVTRLATAICANSSLYGYTYTTQFILSTNNLTWGESVAECSKKNATLAIVDTASKDEEVNRIIKAGGIEDFVWLGGSDKESEGKWTWVDGRPMEFEHWAKYSGQPNNYFGQDCLAVIYKDHEYIDWFDNACDQQQYFMCERIVLL